MKTYVLLHFEQKNNVTIIVNFLWSHEPQASSSVKLDNDCDAIFVKNITEHSYTRSFILYRTNATKLSLRKLKVFALQILQRYLTKEGRVRKFFHCLYG